MKEDEEGEYYHLVTLWKATRQKRHFMQNTRRRRKAASAETIARMADEGKDVSRFFTNRSRMQGPIQRVNVDLAAGMLEELDRAARELNVSRRR